MESKRGPRSQESVSPLLTSLQWKGNLRPQMQSMASGLDSWSCVTHSSRLSGAGQVISATGSFSIRGSSLEMQSPRPHQNH